MTRLHLVALTLLAFLLAACTTDAPPEPEGGAASRTSEPPAAAVLGEDSATGDPGPSEVAEDVRPEAAETAVEPAPEDLAAAPAERPQEVPGGEGDAPPAPEPADEPSPEPEEVAEEASERAPAMEEEDAVALEEATAELSGFVSASYRLRSRGGDNDEDFYGYLSLDWGREERNDLSFHLFGRATFDIDGDETRATRFTSLNDVFGDRFNEQVYEAYVTLRRSLVPDSLGIHRIRIGRQNVYAGYTYLLDGARIDFEPIEGAGNLEISVYGGVPEYLYESSRSGDWMVGTDLRFRPFDRTRVDLRYVHVEDRNPSGGRTRADDYAAITIRQSLADNLHVTGEWNTIAAATRDVRLSLSWQDVASGLALRAAYRYQADLTEEFSTSLDPFVGVLGDSFAYHHLNATLSKTFGDHFGIDAGVTGRWLADGDDEGPFNREFMRAWLSVSTWKWPSEELGLSLTGDLWAADQDRSASVGGEIRWTPTDGLKLTAGSYYSLFKYDLFIVDEREDATTFFLRLDWKVASDLRLDARYEFETGDEGKFHSALLGLTWSF